MRKLLGRIGEWAVTHPAPTIAGVVSVVAIVGVIGALRLSPDAGTDKLVDNGSASFQGTEEFRDRFGDDAIVVLAAGDLKKLVLTDNVQRLLALEGCLAGNAGPDGQYLADVCREINELGATRVVFGPATFLNEAAVRANEEIAAPDRRAAGVAGPGRDAAGARVARRDGADARRHPRRPLPRQHQLRPVDRLRRRAGRQPAEGEVRLPLPLRGGRADLDPAAPRHLRRHPA